MENTEALVQDTRRRTGRRLLLSLLTSEDYPA